MSGLLRFLDASPRGYKYASTADPLPVTTISSSSSPTITTEQGKGTLGSGQATVATTATQIAPARSTRGSITIVNEGTVDVRIGAAGVTTATGALLTGTKGASLTLNTTAAVFGIVATGTQAVSFVEGY